MNDLTTLSNNLPAHLRATDDQLAEFQTGLSGGLDIPFLSIRGKEFRFRYQGNETSTRSRTLDAVVVASRPNVSKRWYGKGYEPGSIDPPDCFSLNGHTPSELSPERQSDKCSTCPRNQFGSKITASGKPGKECSDYKRFIILPVLDGQITDTAVVVDLPYTSLKKNREDRRDIMMWQEYGGALHRHKIPPYGVITRLEFTDSEYPQVCFSYVRALTEDEMKAALTVREDETVQAALSEEQVEPSGPITELAAPETKPEAPKADTAEVANLLKGQAAPEPEPESEPEPEPKPKPKAAAKPTPKAEPEPEPEEGEQGDLMAQIRASLSKMGG